PRRCRATCVRMRSTVRVNCWRRASSARIPRRWPTASSIRSSKPVTQAPDVFVALVDALDGFAAALESGRAEAVLAAGEPLAEAATRLRAEDLPALAARSDARHRLDDIRLRLDRCRALGAVSAELLSLMAPPAYGRRGLQAPGLVPPPTLASKV